MSKRHAASRRRTYGRRQHELTERRGQQLAPEALDGTLEDLEANVVRDHLAGLDLAVSRLRFASGS